MKHKRKQFLLTIAIALLGMTSASGQQFYDKDYVGSHFPIGWKPYIDHSIRILSGIDNDKSKEWAVNTLTVIVEKGASPYAMNCLGVAYMEGLGVEPDSAKAISLLEKAARGGNNSGYVNLGMIYHMGKCGVKQDYKKAYDYYSKGARKGSAYCRYCKGFLLFNGLGCKQDYRKAVRCFRRSANERHVSSIYMLGLCYRNGYGVEKDEEKAADYLYLAAILGNDGAREKLSLMLHEDAHIFAPVDIHDMNGEWKFCPGLLARLGLDYNLTKGQCSFKKDGTFEIKINGRESRSFMKDTYSSPQSNPLQNSVFNVVDFPSSHRLMTVKVKGTYQVNDGCISTTVNPDGVYCYIEAGDYPEPVDINDSKMTMEQKEIEEFVYENRESEADRKSNVIKRTMLKFWQWEKEPIRMAKNHLMIGYNVMVEKK